MGIVYWIIMGLIVGLIAKFVTDEYPGGCLMTVVLGIAGAFLGGFIGKHVGLGSITGFNLTSFLLATGGAILLLILYRVVKREKK